MTDSLAGSGIEAVHEATDEHHRHLSTCGGLEASRRRRARFELSSRVTDRLAHEVAGALDTNPDLVGAVLNGTVSPIEAASRLRRLLEG